MAQTKVIPKIELGLQINLQLSLAEAKALREIIVFGIDPFLKVFYNNLGESTMKREEVGMRSLFKTIGDNLPTSIHEAEEIVKTINILKNGK